MHLIHLVDNIEPINQGIWKAAISTAPILKSKFGITSEIWFPKTNQIINDLELSKITCKEMNPRIFIPKIHKEGTIILSHGVWQYPTRWASEYKKEGIPWVYNPQGMLEPWSMKQKWLKKQVYYHLKEKPLAFKADIVRAVGKPEFDNLSSAFKNVVLIPNGIDIPVTPPIKENIAVKIFLFMARLHHKKGIVPLVEGWLSSSLKNINGCKLVIAGPDQGEFPAVKEIIERGKINNIEYHGPVYGEEKENLLKQSSFYVLPSYSEGFPTSVVEAMSRGLIPLISKGCNFPEAFENNIAISAEPNKQNIRQALESAICISESEFSHRSNKVYEFVKQNYSLEHIADMQYNLFKRISS